MTVHTLKHRTGYVHNHGQDLFSLYIHIHSIIFYMHHPEWHQNIGSLLLPPGSCPSQAGGGTEVGVFLVMIPTVIRWSETRVGYAADMLKICLYLNEIPQVQPWRPAYCKVGSSKNLSAPDQFVCVCVFLVSLLGRYVHCSTSICKILIKQKLQAKVFAQVVQGTCTGILENVGRLASSLGRRSA